MKRCFSLRMSLPKQKEKRSAAKLPKLFLFKKLHKPTTPIPSEKKEAIFARVFNLRGGNT